MSDSSIPAPNIQLDHAVRTDLLRFVWRCGCGKVNRTICGLVERWQGERCGCGCGEGERERYLVVVELVMEGERKVSDEKNY